MCRVVVGQKVGNYIMQSVGSTLLSHQVRTQRYVSRHDALCFSIPSGFITIYSILPKLYHPFHSEVQYCRSSGLVCPQLTVARSPIVGYCTTGGFGKFLKQK